MKNRFVVSFLVLAVSLFSGCATPVGKPALYPNAHYLQMGPAQAQVDAQMCATLAQQSDVGVVNKIDADRSADATAGVGIAAATAASQSVDGSDLYRQFVQQCLAERGYRVIGWY